MIGVVTRCAPFFGMVLALIRPMMFHAVAARVMVGYALLCVVVPLLALEASYWFFSDLFDCNPSVAN
jgi:hypothetical protein